MKELAHFPYCKNAIKYIKTKAKLGLKGNRFLNISTNKAEKLT